MGTEYKRMWIPTDARFVLTVSCYQDLEDGDWRSEMAQQIAQDELPSSSRRDELESAIRQRIIEGIEGDIPGDINEVDWEFEWNHRNIEVCEWCKSSDCDGDDCDVAPSYCDGCDEYTNGECDCVWCDECEVYNCETDHNGPVLKQDVTLNVITPEQAKKAMEEINAILAVANENLPDIEAVL